MDIERETLSDQHYLYVERDVPMEGPAIAEAMGSGFAEVFGFFGKAGIAPLAMPMSVYTEMPSGRMTFRCGAIVSAADATRAEGAIKADVLPGGDAMTVTHVGPYDSLNQTHRALWNHMEAAGIPAAMPVWEIYLDDPGQTAPEALRTRIFRHIGA